MTPETFCEQFATFAEAPNGVAKLRELILQLAVQGKLGTQDVNDEPAVVLFSQIQAERTRLISEGVMRRSKPLPPVGVDDLPFQIPTRWSWIRFDDVGDWGAGATPNRGRLDYFGGNIKWFKSGELNDAYIDDSEEKITELALKECSLRENEPGDVLVAMYGATIGKVAILNVPATTNQAVCACTCHSGIFNRYLFLMLKAFKPYFISNSSGAAQPNFSKEKIVRTPFPLPPLAEQRRIVGKVDQLLGLCDELAARQAARREARSALVGATLDRLVSARSAAEFPAHAHRLRDHFDRLFDTPTTIPQLRQAILQLAVQGQLVPQDPNDEPVDDLLDSIKAGKSSASKSRANEIPMCEPEHDIPPNWRWASVGELVTLKSGFTIPTDLELQEGDLPFLRVGDMNLPGNQDVITTSSRFAARSDAIEGQIIPPNSIVFPKRGGAIATNKKRFVTRPILADSNVMAMICPTELCLEYLSTWLRTIDLAVLNSGTSVPQINNKDVAPLPVPVPPLSEQKRIVSKVTELLSLCDALEAKLTQAESASTQLLAAAVHHLLYSAC